MNFMNTFCRPHPRKEARLILANYERCPPTDGEIALWHRDALMKCVRLRVKNVNFSRREILIRDGKGEKDLPATRPFGIMQNMLNHSGTIQASPRIKGRKFLSCRHICGAPPAPVLLF